MAYDIDVLTNPTAGLLVALSTASVQLSTAINNNETLLEVGNTNQKQHTLWDKVVADINQALNTLSLATRTLTKT